jgi:hypothetical protein
MTPRNDPELSSFALDVYWASGRASDPAVTEHVSGCTRCQAYLASLDASALQPSSTAPAFGAAAPQKTPPPGGLARRANRTIVGAFGALALAASVSLLVLRSKDAPNAYVGAKGTPAVEILVVRDRETRIWDERSRVHPGDALALRVACAGLRDVAVASREAAGWTRLSDVECPADGVPLPFSLRVDDEPGEERLAVVLSERRLDDGALEQAIDEQRRAKDVWVARFVLPKESGVTR